MNRTKRKRIAIVGAVAAAAVGAATAGALLAGRAAPDASLGAAPVNAAAHDPRGQRACDWLLDPDDRLLVIERGLSDDQVRLWGGRVHQIAATAARAELTEVAQAGQAILDYMPDMTFEVGPLWELAVSLAETCVAGELATGRQLHDAMVED